MQLKADIENKLMQSPNLYTRKKNKVIDIVCSRTSATFFVSFSAKFNFKPKFDLLLTSLYRGLLPQRVRSCDTLGLHSDVNDRSHLGFVLQWSHVDDVRPQRYLRYWFFWSLNLCGFEFDICFKLFWLFYGMDKNENADLGLGVVNHSLAIQVYKSIEIWFPLSCKY